MLKDDLKKLYKVACDDAVACFREVAEYDSDALVFEDGLKLAKDTFEQKVRELCPLKRFMSEGDVYDLVFDGWEDYGEHIRERCRKVALELKRDRSAELIRQTTAEAVIVPAIRRIGRPYHLEYQKYRLKVSLLTEQARVFEFYIRYRDFTNQEIIGSIPERTRAVLEYIRMFGPQLRLKGGYADLEWEDDFD